VVILICVLFLIQNYKIRVMDDFEFSDHYINSIDNFKELPLKAFR